MEQEMNINQTLVFSCLFSLCRDVEGRIKKYNASTSARTSVLCLGQVNFLSPLAHKGYWYLRPIHKVFKSTAHSQISILIIASGRWQPHFAMIFSKEWLQTLRFHTPTFLDVDYHQFAVLFCLINRKICLYNNC